MRTVLGLLLVFALSTALWAQDRSPDCYQLTFTGSDTGCANVECDGSVSNCTTYNFTAACSGTYYWDVWTTCAAGSCGKCRSCSYLYEDGNPIPGGNCHTSNCGLQDCNETCAVTLEAGHDYVLYVCLYNCPGYACSSCGTDCKAYACLRISQAAPCY